VLEGRDFARITQTAGRISTLSVGNVGFGLSRDAARQDRDRGAEHRHRQLQAEGPPNWPRAFGFGGYTLREVSVNANDSGPIRPRVMAMQAKSFSGRRFGRAGGSGQDQRGRERFRLGAAQVRGVAAPAGECRRRFLNASVYLLSRPAAVHGPGDAPHLIGCGRAQEDGQPAQLHRPS